MVSLLLFLFSAAAVVADDGFPVRTMPLQVESILPTLIVQGKIEDDPHLLSFRLDGWLERLNIRAGQRVEKGRPLATLDSFFVDRALHQNRLRLIDAQKNLKRLHSLLDVDAASRLKVDDIQLNLDLLLSERATLAERKKRHVLLAPDEGLVLERLIDHPGQLGRGITVFAFKADSDPWRFSAWLRAEELSGLKNGTHIEMTLPALPEAGVVVGTIREMDAVARETDGLYRVRGDLANKIENMRAGLRVRLSVPLGKQPQRAFPVPLGALLNQRGLRADLYVGAAGEGSTAKKMAVQLMAIRKGRALVTTDLSEFKGVVVQGQRNLSDGATIRFIPDTVEQVGQSYQ